MKPLAGMERVDQILKWKATTAEIESIIRKLRAIVDDDHRCGQLMDRDAVTSRIWLYKIQTRLVYRDDGEGGRAESRESDYDHNGPCSPSVITQREEAQRMSLFPLFSSHLFHISPLLCCATPTVRPATDL